MSKKTKHKTRERFILDDNSSFSAVEAFKAARTNLMFLIDKEDEKNSIVFTSYAPMDGKTTSCINLAITFAQTGAKILVIDADLRKPSVHKHLKIQSRPGLSDVLAGRADNEPCVYKTAIDNLYVLPAGTISPNPTELLMSQRMDNLLQEFTPLFDYIFIDTPPIGLVTDTAIIGAKTLGVINLVNCERSRYDDIESVNSILQQAGVNLIGCLINALPLKSARKKYRNKGVPYGYYGFYGYGYYSQVGGKYGYSADPYDEAEQE